ncbi:MAG: hypothetical protein HYR88_14380 [Verrucomicrobia bacterium]|nr:hypothetical protein [Verrucomicrobiota bacterium]
MKLSELSYSAIQRIRSCRFDRIIEKHEGPERWASVLDYHQPEFLAINGYDVLLPVGREHHPHVSVLRCIVADDARTLTLFLKDTTHVTDPVDEESFAGRVAICDRLEGEEFFLAILYHEWFIIE